jgi:hypothetical protein
MKLGTYTLEWTPDNWTLPKEDRQIDFVKTYSSVAVFSWGATLIGKKLELEWDWMTRKMFEDLAILEAADTALTFDPEQKAYLWHGTVTNGPWVVGDMVTGGTSGHTGTIVEVGYGYIVVSGINGKFERDEAISYSSRSATLSNVEQAYPLTVQILSFVGELAGVTAFEAGRREKVKLVLLVMGEA